MLTSSNLIVIYIVVLTTSAFVVVSLIRLLRHAAVDLGHEHRAMVRKISVGLVIWPLFALFVNLTFELIEVILALMIAVPILASLWIVSRPAVTGLLRHVSLHKLVALSLYRVVGALFLYLYYSSGTLSREFAMNAGWGDIITGVLAVPVAWMLWKKLPLAPYAFLAWSVFGILDLFAAPASALLFGPQQLVSFPLGLIPVFLGPPFGIVLHIVTLRVAWAQNRITLGGDFFSERKKGELSQ